MEQGRKGRKGGNQQRKVRGKEGVREGEGKKKQQMEIEIEKGSGSYTIGSVRMYKIFLGRGEVKPLVS